MIDYIPASESAKNAYWVTRLFGGIDGVARMKTTRLLLGIISVALIARGSPVAAEVVLPNGPNRDLVARICSSCHDLGMVVGTGGRSRPGWNGTIDDMVSYGLSISSEERAVVLEYLSTYLPFRQSVTEGSGTDARLSSGPPAQNRYLRFPAYGAHPHV
jgi:hypothetical protein